MSKVTANTRSANPNALCVTVLSDWVLYLRGAPQDLPAGISQREKKTGVNREMSAVILSKEAYDLWQCNGDISPVDKLPQQRVLSVMGMFRQLSRKYGSAR